MVPIDLAIHEIGHAIAALSEPGAVLVSVTVVPANGHAGLVRVRRRRDADPRRVAVTCLAGYAAETRWLRGPAWQPDAGAFKTNGHLRDISDAAAAIAPLGLADPSAELLHLWGVARGIIERDWTTIERLAYRLRRVGCMSGTELQACWHGVAA